MTAALGYSAAHSTALTCAFGHMPSISKATQEQYYQAVEKSVHGGSRLSTFETLRWTCLKLYEDLTVDTSL
jgi:hypothetical protein